MDDSLANGKLFDANGNNFKNAGFSGRYPGVLTYVPEANFPHRTTDMDDNFTFTISDGIFTETVDLNVTVKAIQDDPYFTEIKTDPTDKIDLINQSGTVVFPVSENLETSVKFSSLLGS